MLTTDDESLIRTLLSHIAPDADRAGLRETPHRVIEAWKHWTSGYGRNPADVLKIFEDGAEGCDALVFQGNLPVYSTCEHHLAAIWGVCHIGYIPTGRIVGLSKLSRLVEIFARRLQVQERLTTQIADALNEHLQPLAVGVVLRCRHMCVESRGVEKTGTIFYTSALRGEFKDDTSTARAEFLRFVELADIKSHI